MPNKLTIRFRNALGSIEAEWDGDTPFAESGVPALLDRLLRPLGVALDPPAPGAPRLAGLVRDYFTGSTLTGVEVRLLDAGRTLAAATDGQGRFELVLRAPVDVLVRITGGDTISPTINGPMRIASDAVAAEFHAVALNDLLRQYASVNLARTPGAATVIIELQSRGGGPVEGVPTADMALLDGSGAPAGAGPFIFGPGGDVQPQSDLQVSTAFEDRTRVAFLNVPAGVHRFRLAEAPGIPGPMQSDVDALEGSTTIALVRA